MPCGDLSRHFQYICESCLREEEKAKMTSRKTSSGNVDKKLSIRLHTAGYVRQTDQKLLQMVCKDIQRKLIRSSEESDQLIPIHGTPIRNDQLIISASSPSRKSKRKISQEETDPFQLEGESVI